MVDKMVDRMGRVHTVVNRGDNKTLVIIHPLKLKQRNMLVAQSDLHVFQN